MKQVLDSNYLIPLGSELRVCYSIASIFHMARFIRH